VHKSFEYGTWGGEIRPEFEPELGDIVAAEHWCPGGFANTDLELKGTSSMSSSSSDS
jgi:nicotinamidase-related amidase